MASDGALVFADRAAAAQGIEALTQLPKGERLSFGSARITPVSDRLA